MMANNLENIVQMNNINNINNQDYINTLKTMRNAEIKQINQPVKSNNNDDDSDLDDDEISHNERPKEKSGVTSEFQDKVIRYLKIEDILKDTQKEIKGLRNEKKKCEDFIIVYLKKLEADHINVNGGKLNVHETKRKGALKPEYIKQVLIDELKDESIVEKLIKRVDDKRPVVVKSTLRKGK
jgi:hypothetical protein